MCYKLAPLSRELVPALAELEKKCFSVPWTEAMFLGDLDSPHTTYRVILHEGEPVAYMGLWKIADEGHITNVAVHPDHRRRGLAQQLIQSFLNWGKEEHLSLLTLEVREHNLAAIRLYEGFGFEQVGRRPLYYEGKEDALLYTVFLNTEAEGE
ncbi:MAG: ribosomal-protein-alanine N-acetyltransferase [Ruminococcaceae bacterium]|nr:ribosomal-protein-alanine N-acetyltransferase [Oscillospiraceae bacterium]